MVASSSRQVPAGASPWPPLAILTKPAMTRIIVKPRSINGTRRFLLVQLDLCSHEIRFDALEFIVCFFNLNPPGFFQVDRTYR